MAPVKLCGHLASVSVIVRSGILTSLPPSVLRSPRRAGATVATGMCVTQVDRDVSRAVASKPFTRVARR